MNQPITPAELYRGSWRQCLRLCIVSSILLSAAGLVLLPLRDEILDKLLGLFLPADWLASFRLANQTLFHQVGGVMLFQTVAIICFSAVSLLFFPFRDRISLHCEQQMIGQCERGPGLHRELWYEAGLVLIAFNVYSAVYLLAYFVGRPLFTYIDLLAFALLALFFVLDLLSPPHFRRSLNSVHVFKAFVRMPLQLCLFGLLFCTPIYALELLLGDLVHQQQDDVILGVALVVIIVVNCIVCTFALPLGTWLALSSMAQAPARSGSPARHRVFYVSQVMIAGLLLFFYASVVLVLLNKVPLKSASYDIQWLSLDYVSGSEGEPPRLRFDVRVVNHHPTLGLEVNDADLLLNLDGRYLGEAGLTIPYVAPQSAALVPVDLKLRVDLSEFAGIAWEELVGYFGGEPSTWRDQLQVRLDVSLPLGLKLPVYITQGYRHKFEDRR